MLRTSGFFFGLLCGLFCTVAAAQYNCPNPNGGERIVQKLPEKGCADMLRGGELLSDDDVDKAMKNDLRDARIRGAEVEQEAKQAAAQLKKMRAGFAALAKSHPKSCRKVEGNLVCQPVPGMAIRPLIDALELEHEGFVHSQRGRTDIYSYYTCRIHSNAGKVTFVSC